MKKILAIVMSMMLVMGCFTVAFAAADATATVATVAGTVSAGDEVRVPITITDYANAYATIDIDNVTYDDTLLEFVGFEESEKDFIGATIAIGEAFALITLPTSETAAAKVDGGEICVLVFNAVADITVSTAISATVTANGYVNGSADNWVVFDTLTVDVVSGGIDPEAEPEPAEAVATVGTVQGPFAAGDEIAIPITITEWANAYATIDITLPEYDEELLTLDAIEASTSDFGGALTAFGPLGFALVASPSSQREAAKVDGGEVCIMYFYAAQDITASTSVSVGVAVNAYTVGEEDNWLENRTITVESVAGGINVVEPHTCVPTGEIQYDDTYHWYNCEVVGCGNQVNKAAHEGGEATCISKAVCSVCNQAYGSVDSTNHLNTEVRDASETYTGDTWCTDCNTIIQEGTDIAPTLTATATIATLAQNFNAGDEVRLPIVMSQFDNAYGTIAVTDLVYDSNLLELVEIAASETDFIGSLTSYNAGKFAMIASPANATAAAKIDGGELCVIVFTAKTDIREATEVSATITGRGYSYGAADNWTAHENMAITVVNGGIDTHECTPGELKYDETNHWYVCAVEGCDNILNEGAHEGGEATCCAKAECTVCGQEYGDIDSDNHGDTEVRNAVTGNCGNDGYTGDTYCLDCGEMIAEGSVIPATGNHTGGTATCCAKAQCVVCGNEYGEFNANNHVGGTEVRNAVAADCGNDGYTGDIYCLGCNVKTAEGSVIPATGNHTGGEATCCAKAQCTVCGNEYGELDADNHSGGTEVRDAVAPGYTEEGYTGDTYCLGCGEMIEKGSVIAPLGLLGDVNGDGYINSIDAKMVAQYYVGLTTNIKTAVADVNGDGFINSEDAKLIAQYYVGLIEKFPAE